MKAILLLLLCLPLYAADILLINGEVVTDQPQIINIRTGNAGCTATVIGKRAIITAAHCASTGSTSTFKVAGVSYSAKMTRSPIYPGKDHDIALGVVSKDVATEPSSLVSRADVLSKGQRILFYGYGCTKAGGGGGSDGKLRKGYATVTGFSNYDVVSSQGAALCYGDSGGPGFMIVDPGRGPVLVSINSKGNISTTNYTTRIDLTQSQEFVRSWAQTNRVEVCGVNMDCNMIIPPVPSQFVVLGKTIKLSVKVDGQSMLGAEKAKSRLKAAVDYLDKR